MGAKSISPNQLWLLDLHGLRHCQTEQQQMRLDKCGIAQGGKKKIKEIVTHNTHKITIP